MARTNLKCPVAKVISAKPGQGPPLDEKNEKKAPTSHAMSTPPSREFSPFMRLPIEVRLTIVEIASREDCGRLYWRREKVALVIEDKVTESPDGAIVGRFSKHVPTSASFSPDSWSKESPCYAMSLVSHQSYNDFWAIPTKVNTLTFWQPRGRDAVPMWRAFHNFASVEQLRALRKVEIDIGRFTSLHLSGPDSDEAAEEVPRQLNRFRAFAAQLPRCHFRLRVHKWRLEVEGSEGDEISGPDPFHSVGLTHPPWLPKGALITDNTWLVLRFIEEGQAMEHAAARMSDPARPKNVVLVPNVLVEDPEAVLETYLETSWVEVFLQMATWGV